MSKGERNAMKKTVLKWRNKLSGEEGYVKTVSVAKGYFINTFEASEAKSYRSEKAVEADLEKLRSFGEMEANDFFTVTVEA